MVTRVHRPHAVPRVHVTRLSMIIHDLDLAWPVVTPTEASAPMRHRRLRSQQPPEPEQCEPLAESEAAGWSGRIEPEISAQRVDLCSREFGSQTPPDRAAVAAEGTLDEAPVVTACNRSTSGLVRRASQSATATGRTHATARRQRPARSTSPRAIPSCCQTRRCHLCRLCLAASAQSGTVPLSRQSAPSPRDLTRPFCRNRPHLVRRKEVQE